MSTIHNKAMLIKLSISRWDARKLDKAVTEAAALSFNASADAGNFSKHLIPRDALKHIQKADSAARAYHYANTLPWEDTGKRMLPSKNYMAYTENMRQFRADFDKAVENFLYKYPFFIQKAQERLRDMYNPDDYPTIDAIRGKFALSFEVEPLPFAADFRVDINEEEVEKIRTDLEGRLNHSVESAINDLWVRIDENVTHMYNKLSDPEGKFKDTLVDNVRELVRIAPKLNVLDDPKIDNVCRQMENTLCKFDAQDLRKNEAARTKTADEASKIIEHMSTFMGVAA